jgi:nonribosomal peptide synthetase DhbF
MEKSHFPGESLINRSDDVNSITDFTLRPLSTAQLGIWFAQALDPGSPIFNVGEYLEIFGLIDATLFEKAVRQAVAETDALQVRFIETDDGPRQYLAPDPNWVMPFIDVSAEVDPRASVEAWMDDDMSHPIDLTLGPLFTVALFRAALDRFFYYQRFHHIVADGASTLMLEQRVASFYSALAEGRPAEAGNVGSSLDLLDDEGEYRSSA